MRSILTALQEGRLFELPEAGKDRALEFLARVLDANPDIVVGTDVVDEIKHREQECNTGIGLGVAVPHVRTKREDGELFCAIGWSPEGIEYESPDGQRVHLVFMYYIPGSQKNVYLKEVSSLVRAMKNTGGMGPVSEADGLFIVRNLLLDWVSEASGDTGPEAVARMIKLEVKQSQVAPAPTIEAALPTPPPAGRPAGRATPFMVVFSPPNGILGLSQDADLAAALDKESNLGQRFANGTPFTVAGRQLFITATTAFSGGRFLYEGIAISESV